MSLTCNNDMHFFCSSKTMLEQKVLTGYQPLLDMRSQTGSLSKSSIQTGYQSPVKLLDKKSCLCENTVHTKGQNSLRTYAHTIQTQLSSSTRPHTVAITCYGRQVLAQQSTISGQAFTPLQVCPIRLCSEFYY